MVELETVERGFRAEVRILAESLFLQSPVVAQQLCQEYTDRVHSQIKDIANGRDNVRLVSDRIEGPKGKFSHSAYGYNLRFEVDPSIKLEGMRAYLNEFKDIQNSHLDMSQKLYDLFTGFSQSLKLNEQGSERAVKDHLKWIGESGRSFMLGRIEAMKSMLESPSIQHQQSIGAHINLYFDC